MTDFAAVLGQWSERLIAMTGWIGEHPGDGGDVAHLLVYPTGHSAAASMRAAADMFGLRDALDPPLAQPGPDVAALAIRDDGWVSLYAHGQQVAERPVTAEWAEVARARGQVMLTLGWDGYSGRDNELERYLARGRRLSMGLIGLADRQV